MRSALFVAAAVVLACGEANAQNDRVGLVSRPAWATASEPLPVPADAAGAVFIRRQDMLIHLGRDGQQQHLGYRIKILHANALQLGNLAVTWNPAAGAPTVHAVRVYRGDETIEVLKSTKFEVLRREDQLEAARLDGMLTAVLRVPDLRVGDELEFETTTLARDPSLGDNDAGVLFLAPAPSPGRYHLGLSWDGTRQPKLKLTPDMAAAAVRTGNSLDLRFDNPATITPPKDAPARYQWLRTVEFSDFANWPAISRHFAPLYARAAKVAPTSPIRQEAARIAAANATPMDRARAALKLVQQDVRYIYVGLNGGNLTPASADETWQRRYGDCKGKTALLLALLNELGIEAEPVLVNTAGVDDGFDQRLPSPRLFDHVLVRAKIAGQNYWLDGTLPPVATPTIKPVFPVEWVLPLTSQGQSIEPIAWAAAEVPDELSLYEIDARSGFDKPARITSTTIARGIDGLQAYIQFSAATPTQMLEAFRQNAIGDTWQTIDDVKWRYDEKTAASILTITGTGTMDWDDDKDGARSMSLPGGGFSPPEKRVRAAEHDASIPYYAKPNFSCDVTTVRLPSGTKPQHWSSKPGFDTRLFGRNYYRAFDMRDDTIRMVRGSRTELREIDAATAKRDNARIAAFDNSMGWIFYDPQGTKASVGTGTLVPATYERDWTARDVPCTAATAAR